MAELSHRFVSRTQKSRRHLPAAFFYAAIGQ
jgi:hypothetical protein